MKDTKHYKMLGDIQYKDIVEALYDMHMNDPVVDHHRFHAMKYLFRLGQKDDPLKELKKAEAFLSYAIERQEKINGKR